MIGVVVAMREEAMPIINALGLKSSEDINMFSGQVENDYCVLGISGIGKCNAQNMTYMLSTLGCDVIINVGTCGDCGGRVPGSLHIPSKVFDGDFDLVEFGNPTKDPCFVNSRYVIEGVVREPVNKDILFTYSTFVTDKRAEGHLVDMEGYAVASACTCMGIPYLLVKCISDSADDNALDSFSKNVEENVTTNVVERNITEVVRIINNFSDYHFQTYKTEE